LRQHVSVFSVFSMIVYHHEPICIFRQCVQCRTAGHIPPTLLAGFSVPVEQPRYFVEAIIFAVLCSAQYDAQPRDRCGSPRPPRGLVEFNAYPTDPEKRERALLATQAAYGPSNGIRAVPTRACVNTVRYFH
jgi:hypothetical protein